MKKLATVLRDERRLSLCLTGPAIPSGKVADADRLSVARERILTRPIMRPRRIRPVFIMHDRLLQQEV